jgi:hypothetical protein
MRFRPAPREKEFRLLHMSTNASYRFGRGYPGVDDKLTHEIGRESYIDNIIVCKAHHGTERFLYLTFSSDYAYSEK